MFSSEVRIYGDLEDLRRLFACLLPYDLAYTESLSEVGCAPVIFREPSKLERYLPSSHSQTSKTFVLTGDGVDIVTQNLKMADGSGIKVATGQQSNPDAVLLRLGGESPAMRVIIATSLSTTGETALARGTFRQLEKLVALQSVRVRESYVMPRALEKLGGGWKFAPDPECSSFEDLIEDD
jgi:hypothetical protein